MQDISIKEDNGRIKKVGTIFKKCFYKRVKESKHLMRVSNSWGIDADVFNKVVFIECDSIKILDTENDIMYECLVYVFKLHGQYLHIKPHRAQIFLNRHFFTKVESYSTTKK